MQEYGKNARQRFVNIHLPAVQRRFKHAALDDGADVHAQLMGICFIVLDAISGPPRSGVARVAGGRCRRPGEALSAQYLVRAAGNR